MLLLAATGCLGRSPTPRYFILGEATAPVGASSSELALQLASVVLPDYVARQEMVRRVGAAELSIDNLHRWAGGLEANVLRCLGAGLAEQLRTREVSVYPVQPRVPADFRIDVVFDELIAVQGGSMQLVARWVIEPSGEAPRASGSATLTEPLRSNSAEALIAAHERVLDFLATQIGAQVSALQREGAS